MRTLVRIGQEQILSGIQPATRHDANDLWIEGSNVIFREGGMRPEPGQLLLAPKLVSDPIIGFGESERGGHPMLYWGTRTKLYRMNLQLAVGSQIDEVTRTVGGNYNGREDQDHLSPATRWSLQSWGEWMIAANGVDELQYHRPVDTDFKNISSPPGGVTYNKPAIHTAAGVAFKPHYLVRARGHMLAFTHHVHASATTDNEIADGEQYFWWCDQNNIFDWLAIRANAAGSQIIRDAPSVILSAHPMLDGAAAYTLTTQHLIQYLGDPLWFGVVRTQYGIGALGHHAVVPVGRVHYGAGPQGLWRSDGSQYQYIDHPVVRDWMYRRLHTHQASKTVAWHDPSQERVIWFFCADGSLTWNAAIAFDYVQGTVHIPDYIRSAASIMEAFDFGITGSTTGEVFRQSFLGDIGPADPGKPLTLVATTGLTVGYGEAGYGRLGYGGRWNGVG